MMNNETLKRRIDESMQSARLSLETARKALREASTLASSSGDETLNQDILRDYHHIVAQLLERIDLWKLPIR